MSRTKSLTDVLEYGLECVRKVGGALTEAERERSGTYEVWAAKDGLNHIAEWLSRDVSRIESADSLLESVTADQVDDVNRAVFETHSGKTWNETMTFVESTFAAALELTNRLGETGLDRIRSFSGGSERAQWRMLAAHGLMHVIPHLTLICRRSGLDQLPEEMETRTADLLLSLDRTPSFVGTVKYNLACHYALHGEKSKAMPLLKEAFELEASLKELAESDEDLDLLRESGEFQSLTE